MPAYNAERTIQASIDSVLAQTHKDWELIIINDAAKDSTEEIIKAAQASDSRVTFLTNEKNSGISFSRNRGIKAAQGVYLAFLDSDDLWRSDKLEKQLIFMQENKAVISYTATAYMNAEGEPFGYSLPAKRELSYKDLMHRNLMSCSSVMVRREDMVPFPHGDLHEDYAVWLVIVRKAGCAYGLNEPLLIYRIAKGSKSFRRIPSAIMMYNAYRLAGYRGVGWLTLRYAVHSVAKRLRIRGAIR